MPRKQLLTLHRATPLSRWTYCAGIAVSFTNADEVVVVEELFEFDTFVKRHTLDKQVATLIATHVANHR